jgi:hypothetical protein
MCKTPKTEYAGSGRPARMLMPNELHKWLLFSELGNKKEENTIRRSGFADRYFEARPQFHKNFHS